MKRILLTGSSGFIGSHILEALKDYPVREFVGDIRSEADCVRNLRDIDIVVHTAALTYLPPSWDSPIGYSEVNYGGTINLLKNHEMFDYFLYFSTSHVYGNQTEFPIDITSVPKPDDPYSISKFAAERAVRMYSDKFGFRSLVLRPFNNFGPRQSRHFVISHLIEQGLKGGKIAVRGDTKREFIFVKDTAELVRRFVAQKKTGLIQIARGETYSVLDVAKMISDIMGVPEVELKESYRRFDIQTLWGSPRSLLEAVPDWRFTPLEAGLRETVEWFREKRRATPCDATRLSSARPVR